MMQSMRKEQVHGILKTTFAILAKHDGLATTPLFISIVVASTINPQGA